MKSQMRVLSLSAVILLLCVATAVPAFTQDLSSTPASLQFGNEYLGIPSGSKAVTITNLLTTGITITNIGFDCAGFGITSGIAPFSFGATQSITHYSMYFDPLTAGNYNCNFVISISDGTQLLVPVTGTGVVSNGASSLTASSFTFPNQPLGTTSAGQTVTIQNTGTTAITLTAATISPLSFSISSAGIPVLLHPGNTFPITVFYTPTGVESETGALDLTYDSILDNGVTLNGNGIAASSLVVSSASYINQATQNAAYLDTLEAAGGTGSYTWALSSGTLPTGLTLSSAGVISGAVASTVATGNYTFTVKVTDTSSSATATEVMNLGVFANLLDNCADISFDVPNTTTPITALTDLGTGSYQGSEGGLYPNGSNVRPASHDADGVTFAKGIVPLDGNGNYSPTGKYVLMAIGESTAQNEFDRFLPIANADPAKNPNLVIVNGAQGGATPFNFEDTTSPYWATVLNNYLPQNNVTANQVVAIWMEDTDGINSGTFPTDMAELQTEYENMMQTMHTLFPNLKLVYFSSRVYGGYSNGVGNPDNPEPYAFEVGYAVKWAIADQLNGNANLNYNGANGPVLAPWMSWGTYYWANGMLGRNDGLEWDCEDFSSDGTHPSSTYGQLKVATALLNFLKTDDTTTPWYLVQAAELTPTAGNNQTGPTGTVLPTPLSVLASNTGTAVSGVVVAFSDNGGGGTFNPPTATTNSSGIATTSYTLPATAGTYTLNATSSGYSSASFTETATAPVKALSVSSGNDQIGSGVLPNPLVVLASNGGTAVAGVSVTFSDGGAGGTFNPTVAVTNSSGLASTTYTIVGNATITASATGYNSATFTEFLTGSNVLAITGGNHQTGAGGTTLPTLLSVDATSLGVAQAGVSVTFTDGGAGGSFAPATVLTSSKGVASTAYTLPLGASTISVTGAATGYTSAIFTETSTASGQVLSVSSGNNQTGVAGSALPSPVVVLATNNGTVVSSLSVTFSDGGAGGTFTPAVATTNLSGLATTTYTSSASANGTVTITGTSTGYTSATFTETITSSSSKVLAVNGGNNQTGIAGTSLPTNLTVLATSGGVAVGGITVTFTDNGAKGIFTPPAALTNSSGIASTSYKLGNAGTITVTASSTGYTSTNFTETSTPAKVLTVNGGNNQTGAVSTALPTPISVVATNTGVVVSGLIVTFTDQGAGGTFNPATASTNSSGIASSTYTLPKNPGTYTLTAGSGVYTTALFTETATAAGNTLTVNGGNNQTGTVSTALPTALTVLATSGGTATAGVSVTFSDGGVGGSFNPATAISNSSGIASSIYTLPSTAQTVTVTAAATTYTSTTFTETSTAAVKTLSVSSGNNQTCPLANPLVVLATNNGTAQSGVSVTFSDGGAGGSFNPATVATGSTGLASTVYTCPVSSGTITITAAATGYTSATFTETGNSAGKVITITGGNNQSGTVGTALPVSLAIVATNGGTDVSGLSVTFTDKGAGGSFNPATVVTSTSGVASSVYTLPSTAGTVSAFADASGYTAATFTETATAGVNTLTATSGNNQTGAAGTILPTALTVTASNGGTLESGVLVTFSDGGAGGSFSPMSVTTNSSGLASSAYTLPSTAKTVTVTATAASYTSATFTETSTGGTTKTLAVSAGNNQTGTVSTALPTALAVLATINGTATSGVSVTFNDGGKGGSFNPTTATTNSSGIASSIYTLPATAQTVTITAGSTGYTSAMFTETATAAAGKVLTVTTGNDQSGPAGTVLPVALSVTATSGGVVQAGVGVTFSDNGAGGTFTPKIVATNSSGVASTTYTLPSTAKTIQIHATATGYTSAGFTETSTAPVDTLTVSAGNNQSGSVSTALPTALAVLATVNGTATSGVSVTFSDGGVGGSFNPATATSNSSGIASSIYTLPTTPQTVTVTASSTGYTSTTFTETATAAVKTLAVSAGNNQTGTVSTALPTALAVLATVNGTATSGVSVTFSDGGVGGSFNPATATTNSSGIASSIYTLPATAQTVSVTATSTGYTGATFTETAIPVSVTSLQIISGNKQTGTVGTALPLPIVVQARNSSGVAVAGAAISFTDGNGGTFSPNPAITGLNGQASTVYTLPTVAKSLIVTASDGSVKRTGNERAVAAAASKIAIVSGNNQSANPNTLLPNPLVVSVTDQYANAISGYTVTFSDNGAAGKFSTTTPITNASGQASVTYTTGAKARTVSISADSFLTGSVIFTETVK